MNDAFGSPRGILSRVLSLLGAALICGSSVAQYLRSELAVWLMITTFVACAGWLVLIVFRVRGPHISLVLLAVMVGAGGIAASATGGASLVVAAIAVLWLTRDLRRPVWWGATLGVFAVVVVVAGGLIVQIAPLGMLSMQAGLVVAFLAGESRRQALLADVRSRELIEERGTH